MKKRVLSIALCAVLTLGLFSCTQDEAKSNNEDYLHQDTQPLPQEPSVTIDWGDLFEQKESKNTYVITYSVDLEYNHSVGNEWRYGLKYNDEYIASSSKIVIADSSTKIDLVAFATELDEWNDHGTTIITFDVLSVGQKQTGWATVIVREDEGRYAGNTAKWYFDITIERIK